MIHVPDHGTIAWAVAAVGIDQVMQCKCFNMSVAPDSLL